MLAVKCKVEMVRTIAVVAKISTSTENILLPAERSDAGLRIFINYALNYLGATVGKYSLFANYLIKG